jgi:hypothetical protein
MALESEKTSSTTTPAPEQVKQQITSALSTGDGAAVQSATNLKWVQQARVSRLTRTAATLQAQYGATDPRVVQANAAVAAGTALVARISITNQQMATPAPAVPSGGWVLHGRVFDSQLKPVAKQTVFLVDQTNTYQKQIGFAYTDDTGYFLISSAEAPASPPPSLFVQVANAAAQPVYLAKTAFQPAANSASYQNITLAAGGPIGDPPATVRADALPPGKE